MYGGKLGKDMGGDEEEGQVWGLGRLGKGRGWEGEGEGEGLSSLGKISKQKNLVHVR